VEWHLKTHNFFAMWRKICLEEKKTSISTTKQALLVGEVEDEET